MSRESKSTKKPATARAAVEHVVDGDAVLATVIGLVDEAFTGFGVIAPTARTLVINASKITRMNSFGVGQWRKSMDALPKALDVYLLGCPTFFVDQLNMVLNFGGSSRVLTVLAPYVCPACGRESGQVIDLLADRGELAKHGPPEKTCEQCGGKLELDETPESYFSFATKYGATSIEPAAALLLASQGLYTTVKLATEKPARVIKLVHHSVTYFQIIGTIGGRFRARPLQVGAEGEIVIDLAEVDRFDRGALTEWRRMMKTLTTQVTSITLVDVDESFLAIAGDTLTLARNIAVASVLVPYTCDDCGHTLRESETVLGTSGPRDFADHVCSSCGGRSRSRLSGDELAPLRKASTAPPAASAKVIAQRHELVSRALTDANVAQAGDNATATISADDTILGRYKIVRRLSAGGMAEVFLANQVGIGGFEKPVALKRIQRKLLESRQQAIELFLNEAKIVGRLTHPNIVQMLDIGESQGALYLAMEYVHGRDLRDVLKKLRHDHAIAPHAEACYIVREIAQALDHAYWSTDLDGKRMSVVHRDVTPHNVIIGYDGSVKLLDFGVATSAVTEHADAVVVGKWMYMSPETTMNEPTDHRSDLFSLGVILYLLCCGEMPFGGRDPQEIIKNIRAGQYRPLSEVSASIPEALANLVARMLALSPDQRPQRGQDVVATLNEIMRQHGLESSAPAMATFLANVLPDRVDDAGEQVLNELVRVVTPDNGPTTHQPVGHEPSEKSQGSITPSALTSVRSADISETFRATELMPGAGDRTALAPNQKPEAKAPPPTGLAPRPTPIPPRTSAPGDISKPASEPASEPASARRVATVVLVILLAALVVYAIVTRY